MDAIKEPVLSLQDVVIRCDPFGLDVLLTGRLASVPYEFLKSPRLSELLGEARKDYDCILVDTPPLLPLADCRLIERWVDGFLIVVSAHTTPKTLLEEALNMVDKSKIVGLIFNKDEHLVRTYASYYASYYNSSSQKSPRHRRASRERKAR